MQPQSVQWRGRRRPGPALGAVGFLCQDWEASVWGGGIGSGPLRRR